MKSRQIILAGIGMGSGDVITEEVRQLIEEADCLIGAERMITSAQKIRSMNGLSMRQCERNNRNEGVFIKEYRTEEIVSYIKEHKEHSKIGILLSGDTGFYSGAKKLKERLMEVCSDQIEIYSGISSLSYLASKVGVSWEDAKILSLHGKDMNFVQTIHRHSKTFLLLGGKDTGRHFYETLLEYGLENVQVHVGRQMSYEEEKILSGKLYEMKAEDFEGLCAVLVENPSYCKAAGMHLKDEEFLRGKVPMTKSEVRSVSIAELELTEDAIVYDIGAGTGTICYGLKGGIGSASRTLVLDGKTYTIGVLVQSNFGATRDLKISGKPAGEKILERIRKEECGSSAEDRGSIMTVLATDLPVSERQLYRIIRRCGVGIARTGAYTGHGSGEIMIGFTTANRVDTKSTCEVEACARIKEEKINEAFEAAAEAVEEAILNSMVTAKEKRGLDGARYRSLAEFLEIPGFLK